MIPLKLFAVVMISVLFVILIFPVTLYFVFHFGAWGYLFFLIGFVLITQLVLIVWEKLDNE